MAHGLLDLEMRRRLYALVQEYPGLHVREAARQLDTSLALVEYHVAILRDNRLVREERDDRYVRLFAVAQDDSAPAAPTEGERRTLRILRERLPLHITLFLLDQDRAVQHKAIAEGTEMSKSKLSFHLRKLEAAGVVRKTAEGLFEPVDRARLLRLLLQFPPTTDLRDEFADVWLALYGQKRR